MTFDLHVLSFYVVVVDIGPPGPLSSQYICHIHRAHDTSMIYIHRRCQTEHQCHHDIQVSIRTLFGLTADRFYCLNVVAYATLSNDHSYLQT